jgi:hypothetical protein
MPLARTRFNEIMMIIHFKRLCNRSTGWQASLHVDMLIIWDTFLHPASLHVDMLIIWDTFLHPNYYSTCFV